MIDELARALQRAGHHPTLFTTGESTCPVPRTYLFDQADPDHMGQVVHELRHVAAAYEAFAEFDVVHDHTMSGLFSRSRPDDLPAVTTCHGPFDADLSDLYGRACRDMPVVAISWDQAGRAPTSVRLAAVIHHGIEVSSYPWRRRVGEHLLFLGRMDPSKGVHLAAQLAHRSGQCLVIAAKMRNVDEHRYFDTAVRPLLDSRVTFIGEVGQAAKLELLASAKALVNPICWPEPFGLVMVEALACGTPVIAFANGAAPEIITDGVTGFLVENEDMDELVRALDKVPDLDRGACRAAVEERFSADRMAAEYVQIYHQAIAAKAERKTSLVIEPLPTGGPQPSHGIEPRRDAG